VAALIAAGYTVFAINPLQASRYRERHGVSGAKSDAADAHVLADMVRTDSHQLRPVAGDTAQAAAVKVVTRTHKTLIWERTRCTQRLRHALRDYFPAALEAFEDLDATDTLELLARHSVRRMICQSTQPGECRAGPIDRPGRRRVIRQHGPTQVAKRPNGPS
jgi:transposase